MNPTPHDPSPGNRHRRAFLRRAASLALGGLAAGPVAATEAPLIATPPNALGPFYPPRKPADTDADLTQVAGHGGHAKGTILYIDGHVLDVRGRPLARSELELWQANAFGRYIHPADTDASGPLDPDFQGYGKLVAGADGGFRIKTIKPPPYSGRTPHIHFNVASGPTRLTTQMFFEGEAGNERDGLYRYLNRDDRRASTGRFVDRAAGIEPEAIAVVWEIVLKV